MIIIYDDDEKIASPLGNQFFEKQFDNVYVLNYGPCSTVLQAESNRMSESCRHGVDGGDERIDCTLLLTCGLADACVGGYVGLRKFAELARELVVGEPPPAPPTTVKKKPSRSSCTCALQLSLECHSWSDAYECRGCWGNAVSTPSSARSLSSNTSFSSRATMRSTATSDTKAWK